MNILYISVHSILERDEVSLFQELGHTVFSLHGAYQNGQGDDKRPPLEMKVDPHLSEIAIQCSRAKIHPELIAWADAFIFMHQSDWIEDNWENIKHKKVILRTIGQNNAGNENDIKQLRSKGLRIVRYSPMEERIPGYVGGDATIRFYKDEDEFLGWSGSVERVVNVSQAMFGNGKEPPHQVRPRGDHMAIDVFKKVMEGFNWRIYGPDNELAGEYNGGLLNFNDFKNMLRFNRVYFYTGTRPASYTLGLIEAMMTGIPVVSIGDVFGNEIYNQKTFEIPEIIEKGVNGFYSDSVDELRGYVDKLLKDHELARTIGINGRTRAITLFGKSIIKNQWKAYFDSL